MKNAVFLKEVLTAAVVLYRELQFAATNKAADHGFICILLVHSLVFDFY
jgi:hypothetical protein